MRAIRVILIVAFIALYVVVKAYYGMRNLFAVVDPRLPDSEILGRLLIRDKMHLTDWLWLHISGQSQLSLTQLLELGSGVGLAQKTLLFAVVALLCWASIGLVELVARRLRAAGWIEEEDAE